MDYEISYDDFCEALGKHVRDIARDAVSEDSDLTDAQRRQVMKWIAEGNPDGIGLFEACYDDINEVVAYVISEWTEPFNQEKRHG